MTMRRRPSPIAVLAALAVVSAIPMSAPAAPVIVAPAAADKCEALMKADFSKIQDAPTRLYAAKVVPANGTTPAYCHVTGYVSPQVGFDLKLPLAAWNKRILGIGCGGLCGNAEVFYDILPRWRQPLEHGYVTFGTDMGHHGADSQDGIWAIGNLGGLVDFFHRATHVSTLAVKTITERFYGEPIRYAYFWGDSTGGRQAMMEAEKYPEDYDGVVARCPAIDQIDALQLTWFSVKLSSAFTDVANNAKKITLLANEVMKQCDALDGLKDSVIQDPKACHVDLRPLECRGGQSGASCLTPGEIAAVDAAYRGPHTSKGDAIASGLLPGSEADWIGRYLTTDGSESFYYKFMKDWWRYIAFQDPAPNFEPSQLDYDHDVARLDWQRAMHNATDPDLRRFRDRGGKILMLQGWGDTSVVPGDTVDFYQMATRTMGGPDATNRFLRLFMIPGVGHCDAGGLTGADVIDDLPALEAWREHDEAPASLTAFRLRKYEGSGSFWPQRTPPDPANVAFSRPLYPYPTVARYNGAGDPNSATSFHAVRPPH
ncbi:MAG: tannase/feruloyl esterase family alpha/beta hydrolase [Rhizomicrobium sp.]